MNPKTPLSPRPPPTKPPLSPPNQTPESPLPPVKPTPTSSPSPPGEPTPESPLPPVKPSPTSPPTPPVEPSRQSPPPPIKPSPTSPPSPPGPTPESPPQPLQPEPENPSPALPQASPPTPSPDLPMPPTPAPAEAKLALGSNLPAAYTGPHFELTASRVEPSTEDRSCIIRQPPTPGSSSTDHSHAWCMVQGKQQIPAGKYRLGQSLSLPSCAKAASTVPPKIVRWICTSQQSQPMEVTMDGEVHLVELKEGEAVTCMAKYFVDPEPDPRLSVGAIAGIAVGAAAAVAILAGGAFAAFKRMAAKHRNHYGAQFSTSDDIAFAKPGPMVGGAGHPPGSVAVLIPSAAGAGAAAGVPSRWPVPEPRVASSVPGGGMSIGFTGEELSTALRGVQHAVAQQLIFAVEDSPLAGADPLAAWLSQGMAGVQRRMSNVGYARSDAFVRVWWTHKALNWLDDHLWSAQACAHPAVAALSQQAQPGPAARRLLAQLRCEPSHAPFAAAKAALVEQLLAEVALAGGTAAGDSVAAGYRPVLSDVMGSALRLLLQARGTADGLSIFLPSRVSNRNLPRSAVSFKEQKQQQQQQQQQHMPSIVLDSLPGALATCHLTGEVTIWAKAAATRA
ncbi:hypothetical protein COO60DRAFT_227857 [Scenedesmus sp. NREL 46B-D3]|nr:hypothetical protein COO60DRAFT_227857 [Scenedesmus sp. NREL 46B-D3]